MAPHIWGGERFSTRLPIRSHLKDAIYNYWDHLNSHGLTHTDDMFTYKIGCEYEIIVRKVDRSDGPIHWIVLNEDSEQAAMFKLEWG